MQTSSLHSPLEWTVPAAVSPGIGRALDHIAVHYAEPIPLSRLAALACLSLHRFVTVFRAQVGIPPHQHVCRVRVRAAQLLLAQGMPAASVALDTGFCDQSHLSRHFKRQCGMTPGHFVGRRGLPPNLHQGTRMKLTDFSVLTFDCYGTLIDWESGIFTALQPLLQAAERDAGARPGAGDLSPGTRARRRPKRPA